MKKVVLLLVVLFTNFLSISAQTPACQPDARYQDSIAGVYPLPFIAGVRPNGGINVPACLGRPYSFVWTVRVNDSVTVPNPLGSGTITTAIDSITMTTTGALENLPAGITYACNPPNCVFRKRTSGCVALRGTPANSNTIGVYKLKISGKVYGPLIQLIAPNGYPLTFPGDAFPGEYNLNLYANGDSRCNVATKDLTDLSGLTASPNPTNGKTLIRFESLVEGEFQFTLRNAIGQEVISTPLSITAGLNAFEINAQDLPQGIYIYSISKGNLLTSSKLIVGQ
jgi:hypothetical protein